MIKDEYDYLDALQAIFPAGTLSGAPKICAMQNISEVETERRNFYGGGIGFINYDETLDMCIGIRTILYKDSTVYLQAGGGIVYDSDPKIEFYETVHKMNSVKKAISNAEMLDLKRGIREDTRILLIDNYCSFTYNIYQYVSEIVNNVDVIRNDKIDIDKCLDYTHIILGPGPKSPNETSNYKEILDKCKGKIPVLGICLGHECIYTYFGGKIKICSEIMHGKTSNMKHNGDKLFNKIPNPFCAMRYHSLVGDTDNVPDVIEIISETSNNIIMGIKHKKYDIYGLQFHPESIGTNFGKQLLKNFLLTTEISS
jgi:anthranilate synthase/aminodeoxychorismate synthase-like glutamine amidotransferase